MGYVFGKAFWWILAALLVGGVIGYYWNGWRKSKWVDSSSTASTTTGTMPADDEARLRGRVATLESIVPERDRLRARVTELEAELAACRSAQARSTDAAAPTIQGFTAATSAADVADAPEPAADRFAGVEFDWDAARATFGKRIEPDDLKVVEGIGPKLAELCHAGGITTWAGLADTPVSRLEEIILPLNATGIHKPDTWPRQAELLALGKWDEFKALTDRLTGGRE